MRDLVGLAWISLDQQRFRASRLPSFFAILALFCGHSSGPIRPDLLGCTRITYPSAPLSKQANRLAPIQVRGKPSDFSFSAFQFFSLSVFPSVL
jgi:hypothetical protein